MQGTAGRDELVLGSCGTFFRAYGNANCHFGIRKEFSSWPDWSRDPGRFFPSSGHTAGVTREALGGGKVVVNFLCCIGGWARRLRSLQVLEIQLYVSNCLIFLGGWILFLLTPHCLSHINNSKDWSHCQYMQWGQPWLFFHVL